MKQILRSGFSFLLIVLSVLGLINVYSDNSDVVALAGSVACSSCHPTLVQSGRSPVSQTLTFQTGPGKLVLVECKRAFYFFGDYSCALGQPLP